MEKKEIERLEKYLRKKLGVKTLKIQQKREASDSAEVYLSGEFIAMLYKDDEDQDDVSWNFQMPILEYDLKEAGV